MNMNITRHLLIKRFLFVLLAIPFLLLAFFSCDYENPWVKQQTEELYNKCKYNRHVWGDVIETKATCTIPKKSIRNCGRCDKIDVIEAVGKPLGHTHVPQTGICPVAGCGALTYVLGATGPGGGLIFYRSASGFTVQGYNEGTANDFLAYTACYLEVAPAGWYPSTAPNDPNFVWATTGYEGVDIQGTSDVLGSGRMNTALILAIDANAPPAKACNDYTNNGLSDWFLPSRYELPLLIEQFIANGQNFAGLQSNYYWVSYQYSANIATSLSLSTGVSATGPKTASTRFRPIRAF